MTAHLKFIMQSREEFIGVGLDVHVKQCLPPVQHHDLVLDCLGTKVNSSNIIKDCNEEYPISFHYLEGIFHQ
jgi:hypothetical protein